MVDHPVVDGYELHDVVGGGGSSTVYRGVHLETGQAVAVKVLSHGADEARSALFEAEVSALRDLAGGPHVPSFVGMGRTSGGDPFVVTVLYGASLQDRLDDSGPLAEGEVLTVGAAVASALGHAHRRGVIHGDVKPSNVFDAAGSFVLADFGAGSVEGGMRFATSSFAAPEVLVGGRRPSVRSDLYSVGATLYALTTGRPPFGEEGWRRESPSADLEGVPTAVARVIGRCLEVKPDRRVRDAAELAEALEAVRSARQRGVRGPASGSTGLTALLGAAPQPAPEAVGGTQVALDPDSGEATVATDTPTTSGAGGALNSKGPLEVNDTPREPQRESEPEPSPQPEPESGNASADRLCARCGRWSQNGERCQWCQERPGTGPSPTIEVGGKRSVGTDPIPQPDRTLGPRSTQLTREDLADAFTWPEGTTASFTKVEAGVLGAATRQATVLRSVLARVPTSVSEIRSTGADPLAGDTVLVVCHTTGAAYFWINALRHQASQFVDEKALGTALDAVMRTVLPAFEFWMLLGPDGRRAPNRFNQWLRELELALNDLQTCVPKPDQVRFVEYLHHLGRSQMAREAVDSTRALPVRKRESTYTGLAALSGYLQQMKSELVCLHEGDELALDRGRRTLDRRLAGVGRDLAALQLELGLLSPGPG